MTPLPLELFRFGAANLPLPKKGQVDLVQFDPSLERRKRRKYLESIRKVMFLQNILSYIVHVHLFQRTYYRMAEETFSGNRSINLIMGEKKASLPTL